jgi:hypothetical protein
MIKMDIRKEKVLILVKNHFKAMIFFINNTFEIHFQILRKIIIKSKIKITQAFKRFANPNKK